MCYTSCFISEKEFDYKLFNEWRKNVLQHLIPYGIDIAGHSLIHYQTL